MRPCLSARKTELEDLRLRRAELLESTSALEYALATPPIFSRARWATRVHVAAVELFADFREHVNFTEGPDGLYRDLLMTAPRLSNAVAGLTREHILIRDQVDSLLAKMCTPEIDQDVERVIDFGKTLLETLIRHRRRGSELIYQAYHVDIGGES